MSKTTDSLEGSQMTLDMETARCGTGIKFPHSCTCFPKSSFLFGGYELFSSIPVGYRIYSSQSNNFFKKIERKNIKNYF